MRFEIDIDIHKPTPELELFLAKPNETIIGILNDANNRSATLELGRFNEITLTVPKYVSRKHSRIRNKNYDNLYERYLVKAEYGNLFSEWMVITKIEKVKGDIPSKRVTLKSRQFELNDKRIRSYEVESYTARQVMNDILQYTTWSIGIIDTEFEDTYRAFNETNTTVLNMLYKIAETFVGILEFDTFNKKINLRKEENIVLDLGLHTSYGKYLKSVEQESDAESMVTRLYVYGKDDLGINEVNPTGSAYIENFSYFMHGYQTDGHGNVISSSPYMSDELCQAILDYNEVLNEKDGVFRTLLEERKPIQDEWVQRLNEYYILEMDLIMIEDSLDINKAAGLDITDLKAQKQAKEVQISNKLAEIDDLELELTLNENDIQDLRDELALENHFSAELLKERNIYIIEDEWSDRNYFDVDELYEAGKKKLKEISEPKKELNFSLVQFLEVVEVQHDWDKLGLGYVIYVDYEPIDIEFKALITELKIGFDDRSLGITVSNVDYKSSKRRLAELLYDKAVSTSSKVDMSSIKWDESANKTTEMSEILEGTWDAVKRRIVAGVNESVSIDGRGIRIMNPNYPQEQIIAQSGVIALSKNAGQDWQTAITPDGIIAERIFGRILAGENLWIENEAGSLRFDGEGLSLTRLDEKIKSYIDVTDGIRITRKMEGSNNYEDVFYADVDGILYAKRLILDDNSSIGGYKADDFINEINKPITNERFPNIIPSKVNNVEATGGFKIIQVRWDFVDAVHISRYEVHASKNKGFIPDSSTLVYSGRSSAYNHEADTDETWYFRVRAINTHNEAGSFSDQVEASTVKIVTPDILFGSVIADHLENNLDIAEKLSQNTIEYINSEPMNAIQYTQGEITTVHNTIMSRIDDEVGDIVGSIDNLKDRANTIENTLGQYGGRLDSLDFDVDEINGKIDLNIQEIADLDGRIIANTNNITATANGINARIDSFEQTYNDDMSDLDTTIINISTDIAVVAGQLDLKADKTELNDYITHQTFTDEMSQITVAYDNISARVQATEGVIDGITGDIAGIQTNITNITANVGGIEATVQSISSDLQTAEYNISQVTQTAQGLETTVGTIQTTVSGLETNMTSVNSTISQLPDQINLSLFQGLSDLGVGSRNLFAYTTATRQLSTINGKIISIESNDYYLKTYGNLEGISSMGLRWLDEQLSTLSYEVFNTFGKNEISEMITPPPLAKYFRFIVSLSDIPQSPDSSEYIDIPRKAKIKFEEGAEPSVYTLAPEDAIGFDNILSYINLSHEGVRIHGDKVHISGQTLIDNAVIGTSAIANLAVTRIKIENGAVGTLQIEDAAVTNAKIANLAVDNAKIANASITTVKIGDAAVTNAKIADLAVGTAKIANAAVTNAKIDSLNVTKLIGSVATFVRDSFNGVTSQVQITGTGLYTYSSGQQTSRLNGSGHRFYRDGVDLGNIGTNNIANMPTYRGLVFNLENQASYMSWSYREDPSDSSYTVKFVWYKNSTVSNKGFNFYDDVRIAPSHDFTVRYLTTEGTASRRISMRNATFNGFNAVAIRRDQDQTGVGGGIVLATSRVYLTAPVGGVSSYRSIEVYENGFRAAAILGNTTSSASNVYISGDNGTLYQSTSAAKYKLIIEDEESKGFDYERVLDLRVKSWYDKKAVEDYASYLSGTIEKENYDPMHIKRHFGLIAEDVERVGLSEFLEYNGNELGGIQYERLLVLLIPTIRKIKREFEDEINWLKIENQILKNEIMELKGE